MKRFLLLALTAGLLSGCMSKKEICAKWSAGQKGFSYEQTYKKLGLKLPAKVGDPVPRYCSYYKN